MGYSRACTPKAGARAFATVSTRTEHALCSTSSLCADRLAAELFTAVRKSLRYCRRARQQMPQLIGPQGSAIRPSMQQETHLKDSHKVRLPASLQLAAPSQNCGCHVKLPQVRGNVACRAHVLFLPTPDAHSTCVAGRECEC
jgi:hypothetical protein